MHNMSKTRSLLAAIPWVVLAAGCAGTKEARRLSTVMANATSTYVEEVDGKIDREQEFYRDGKRELEQQLEYERTMRKDWETNHPPIELLVVIENLARQPEKLALPGDLLQALEDYNEEQTRIRLEIAASEAAFRSAYELNLAKLQYKRSQLEELRKQFEGLSQNMSARDWFGFLVEYGKDVQKAIDEQKKTEEAGGADSEGEPEDTP